MMIIMIMKMTMMMMMMMTKLIFSTERITWKMCLLQLEVTIFVIFASSSIAVLSYCNFSLVELKSS